MNNAAEMESPNWHHEILLDRENLIRTGQAGFTDWEQAKQEIRQQVLCESKSTPPESKLNFPPRP
jgi:hypothetical protein